MATDHTAEEPPRTGRTILENSGSIQNSSDADRKIAAGKANSPKRRGTKLGLRGIIWMSEVVMACPAMLCGRYSARVNAPLFRRLQQLLVEDLQHLRQVGTALENHPARRDHAILALAGPQPGAFLDTEQGIFGGAAKDREHRPLVQEIQRIVAPFAGSDHAAIDGQDAIEFGTVESNLRHLRRRHVTRALFLRKGGAVQRYGFFHHRRRNDEPGTQVPQARNCVIPVESFTGAQKLSLIHISEPTRQ